MTTPSVKSKGDGRPEYVKAMDKKLKAIRFPNCYGRCPDVDRSCPPIEEFNKFLSETKKPLFRDIPNSWECKTCIYTEYL